MKRLAITLTLAAVAICQTPANAIELYHQFSPNFATVGVLQDLGTNEHADDFSVPNNSFANFIKWQGGYLNAAPPGDANFENHFTESFTVSLYSNVAGLPSASPLYSVTGAATGDGGPIIPVTNLRGGRRVYDYGLDLPDWALSAGVTYWISIDASDAFGTNNWAWSQSFDGSADGAFRNTGSSGSWSQMDNPPPPQANHVFFLYGTVPAPGTVALFGLGLLGLVALRRYTPARSR